MNNSLDQILPPILQPIACPEKCGGDGGDCSQCEIIWMGEKIPGTPDKIVLERRKK